MCFHVCGALATAMLSLNTKKMQSRSEPRQRAPLPTPARSFKPVIFKTQSIHTILI